MVKLTLALGWNGFHNLPKKWILRKMFKGVVYGECTTSRLVTFTSLLVSSHRCLMSHVV